MHPRAARVPDVGPRHAHVEAKAVPCALGCFSPPALCFSYDKSTTAPVLPVLCWRSLRRFNITGHRKCSLRLLYTALSSIIITTAAALKLENCYYLLTDAKCMSQKPNGNRRLPRAQLCSAFTQVGVKGSNFYAAFLFLTEARTSRVRAW